MTNRWATPDIDAALQIPGWTNPAELRWLAEQALNALMIVEIGSWKGRSTRAIADNTAGVVYAVDTWKGTKEDGHYEELESKPEDWLYLQFLKNVADAPNVRPSRGTSLSNAFGAACGHMSFDMIFIDAAHDYENVKADILAWRPLLAPGGLLCGHDFDGGRPGVVKAVRELCPRVRMARAGSIWVAE